MDKEKGNSIDDIRKLLMNVVENTDTQEVTPKDKKDSGEQMSVESLTEQLRAQYASPDNSEAEGEEKKDDYAIDESFMSEAETVEEPEIIEESEEIEEPETSEESQIINIAIPWVESIPDGALEEYEDEPQDAEFDEEDGPEKEDDYSEKEDYEGGFVRFAESEDFGGEEEEMTTESDDEEDEYEEVTEVEDFANAEEIDEFAFADAIVEASKEEVTESESTEESDEDDLPWYDDPAQIPMTEVTITKPVENEVIEDISDDEELAVDDQQTSEENVEDLSDSDTESDIDLDEIVDELHEAFAQPISSEDEVLIEELIENAEREAEDEDDGESFYRTMVEAQAARELMYAKRREESENAEAEKNTVESDLDFRDDEADEPFEKNENTEEANVSAAEGYRPLGDIEKRAAEAAADIPADFYGTGEHDSDPDEDVEFSDDDEHETLDFENDSDEAEKLGGFFERNPVLRIVRRVISAVLAFGMIILELLPILKIVPDGLLDYTSYPVSYILIDTQLFIFLAALFYDKLIDGFTRLFDRNTSFWSVISVTALVTLLHSIISCFGADEAIPSLYNSISALYIIAMYIFELVDEKRARKSVELLSQSQNIFTLKHSQGKNSCAEKMYLGGVHPDTNILEPVDVSNGDFDGAFAREEIGSTRRISFAQNLVTAAITPAIVFAVCMTVISIVLERGLAISVNAFAASFIFVAPLAAILAHYIPLFITHSRLFKRGCVVAGYEGAAQIGDCDALVFSDRHLFKDCTAKEAGIKLYCEGVKVRELFVCLASVYEKLGGPMKDTFASVLGSEKHKVNMVRITRNGFEAIVDSRTVIVVGSSEYLSRYGIVTDRADHGDVSVIYAAMNSVLCAKMSVAYRTQPLFEALGEMLDKYSIRTVIETYDPLISGKYVTKCRTQASENSSAISVVHKNVNDYNTPPAQKSPVGRSGAFVTDSRLKLVELAIFCKRLIGARKINSMILIGAYVFSALLGIIFTFSGAIEHVNLLWVLVYQAVLVAIYALASTKYLPLSFDEEQNRKMKAEYKRQENEEKETNQDKETEDQ